MMVEYLIALANAPINGCPIIVLTQVLDLNHRPNPKPKEVVVLTQVLNPKLQILNNESYTLNRKPKPANPQP